MRTRLWLASKPGEPRRWFLTRSEVEDVRAVVADAIARLEVVATERSDTLTVSAHDNPEVTLARLSTTLRP
jgi:hypothetical protein